MARVRADVLVVEQGLAQSRSRAQALILAGVVLTEAGEKILKAGQMLAATTALRLKEQPIPFVSRGGVKLEGALEHFGIDVTGMVGLDVGASTGGFTDCLLQRGALKVFAVDVGYNQLAWSLRQDPRVVSMERLNVRHLEPSVLGESVDIVVADVSFISLGLVMGPAMACAKPGARLVSLVKPQFEVGRDEVGKGGIVRDPQARWAALRRTVEGLEHLGLMDIETMDSPITGTKGNHEFLLTGIWNGTGDSI